MVDLAEELEGTFKLPRALIAFLAVIVGILVLFFPYIINIMIAFFLIVWELLKAVELTSKPSKGATSSAAIPSHISDAEFESES